MHDSQARAWLSLQREMLPGTVQALVLARTGEADRLALLARWPESGELASEAIQGAQQALAQNGPVVLTPRDGGTLTWLACPVRVGRKTVAAAAFAVDSAPGDPRETLVPALRSGCAFLGLLLARDGAELAGPALLARAFSHDELQTVALAVTSDLARQLGCERVSLGLRRDGALRVVALSDQGRFSERSPLVRAIATAMEEALERKPAVVFRSGDEEAEAELPRHHRLSAEGGCDELCSVPLLHRDRAVGALTLERTERPFDAAQVAFLQSLVPVLAPMLALRQTSELPWPRRLRAAVADGAQRLAGPPGQRNRVALGAAVAVFALLVLARAEHRVAADASIEGHVHRAVVAPYDGYVESAAASAGDVVETGQVLATLQQRDLQLEHLKRTSEREELVNQYNRALSQLDHAEAKVFLARKAQTDAELELLDEQLARTRLTAPFDGVVVTGDLSRSLGAPVQQGELLFEVAPLEGYRVVLQVDERDIAGVAKGQEGLLTLTALPSEKLPFTVEKVTPVSSVADGRNVFRVEARLEGAEDALRPGMAGVAKVGIGRRNLVWIWTHPLLDWLRLQLWAWRP